MKKYILLLFVIFSINNIFAQQRIHLIKIVDTDVPGHGDMRMGAEELIGVMNREIVSLAKGLGFNEIDLKTKKFDYEVTGSKYNNNFSLKSINELLDTIACKNDIVIVATYTHGVRSERPKDVYPLLSLASETIHFQDILNKLISKKPSFMLSIVTSCQAGPANNIFSPQIETKYVSTASGMLRSPEKYEKLFIEKKDDVQTVSVEFLSCSPSEYSYVDIYGGPFFYKLINIFRTTLDKNSNVKEINWKYIANELNQGFVKQTKNRAYGSQCPNSLMREFRHNKVPVITKLSGCYDNPKLTYSDYYKPYKNGISHTFAVRLVKLANSYRSAKCDNCNEYALETLDKAIEVLRKHKDIYFEASAIELKGIIHYEQGKLKEAEKELFNAMVKFKSINCCGSATTIKIRLINDLNVDKQDIRLNTNCK